MKKILIIILILFTAETSISGVNFDIRKSRWGMTRVEVLASEDIRPLRLTMEYISYKINIFNKDVFLLYEFVENSLLGVSYYFEESSDEINNNLHKILQEKYGKPEEKGGVIHWNNDKVLVLMEKGEKSLRIYYKSKEIEKIRLNHSQRIEDDEKKYLFSIF